MRIADDVLAVLSALEFPAPDQIRIPGQRLDRAMYERVNKVLEAVGGRWSKKDRVHVLDRDARDAIDCVVEAGEVVLPRERDRALGNFATPVALARELVALAGVRHGHRVLEPSAGTGRIADEIIAVGASVVCVERDAARRNALAVRAHVLRERGLGQAMRVVGIDDFMHYDSALMNDSEISPPTQYDRVVMNPPFCRSGDGDHLDHVHLAQRLLASGGVLVSILPASVTFRQDVRHQAFRDWVHAHSAFRGGSVHGSSGWPRAWSPFAESDAIRELPAGSFRESGTNVRAVVVAVRRSAVR